MNIYIVGLNQLFDIEIDKVCLFSPCLCDYVNDQVLLPYEFVHGSVLAPQIYILVLFF